MTRSEKIDHLQFYFKMQ